MTTIMVPVTFPTSCYIGEIAHWLALGRVPEIYTSIISNDDAGFAEREDRPSFLERGGPIAWDYYGFQANEFNLNSIIVDDYERYFYAKDHGLGHSTGAEHRQKMEMQFALVYAGAKVDDEEETRLRAKVEKEAVDIDWAADFDNRLQPLIDDARAEVFLALRRGELQAFGWPEENGQEEDLSLFPIPASAWTLAGIDWSDSKLSVATPHGVFEAVQVGCDEMLKRFPAPTGTSSAVSGRYFSGCALISFDEEGVSDHAAAKVGRRRKGRPPKGEGELSVRDVVTNYFAERLPIGSDEGKLEALYLEAIAFAKLACHQDIARSSVQKWFKERRGPLPEKVPVNAAGK